MLSIRTAVAPAAATLALIVLLAACGQAQAPSSGTPSPVPSDEPGAGPGPIEVVELDLPVLARVTEDGVEVRSEPSVDAPLATAEDLSGSGDEPEVVLDTGDRVIATLGPVFADGESWYEVGAADGSELHFAFGWIPGRLIEPEATAPGFAPIFAIHGQGEGAEVSTDVLPGSPVTVRFAATPLADAEECDIDVTLVRSDGTPVNVGTDTVTDVAIFQLTPEELSSLFQEEPGTVTLRVETDCSFAATMIAP